MKNRIIFSLGLFGIFCALVLSGCDKSDDQKSPEETLKENLAKVDQAQLQADIAVIEDSLQKWGITPLIEPNGVRYTIIREGTGPTPTLRNNISFLYKGRLLKNRSVFGQGTTRDALKDLVTGWQTTLPLIKEGSKAILYIPSGLAYGTAERTDGDGNVSIPANSNLIFEIEVLDVF